MLEIWKMEKIICQEALLQHSPDLQAKYGVITASKMSSQTPRVSCMETNTQPLPMPVVSKRKFDSICTIDDNKVTSERKSDILHTATSNDSIVIKQEKSKEPSENAGHADHGLVVGPKKVQGRVDSIMKQHIAGDILRPLLWKMWWNISIWDTQLLFAINGASSVSLFCCLLHTYTYYVHARIDMIAIAN